MSLIALLLAPIAGRMSDQVGGKYILMTGLTLYAVGAAVLVAPVQGRLELAGVRPGHRDHGSGHGRHLGADGDRGDARGAADARRRRRRGEQHAAPGRLGRRQCGGRRAAAEPAGHHVAGRGDQAGRSAAGAVPRGGSSTASRPAPRAASRSGRATPRPRAGSRPRWRRRSSGPACEVFHHGYVRAMHPTLILPIAAAFVAAALCLLATRHTTGRTQPDRPDRPVRRCGERADERRLTGVERRPTVSRGRSARWRCSSAPAGRRAGPERRPRLAPDVVQRHDAGPVRQVQVLLRVVRVDVRADLQRPLLDRQREHRGLRPASFLDGAARVAPAGRASGARSARSRASYRSSPVSSVQRPSIIALR